MNRKFRDKLNIEKVVADFQKSEDLSSHRRGTFKIDAPFEKALDTILKSRPDPQRKKRKA